jgi:hypothetical protein
VLLKRGIDDPVYLGRKNTCDRFRVVAEPYSGIRGSNAPYVFDKGVTVTLA